MIAGLSLHSAPGQVLAFGMWTVSVCFVWPALEALVTEGASVNLSDMVGYYNITWALGGAVAYFTAGMMLERLGMQSLFWLPLAIVALQLPLTRLRSTWQRKKAFTRSGCGRNSCTTPRREPSISAPGVAGQPALVCGD